MSSRRRVLFIATFDAPFIRADLEFLQSQHDVQPLVGQGWIHALRIVLAARRSDVVFTWFASVYGAVGVLAARLFGKRSIIQVGGIDLAKDEETGYGIWNSWWRGMLVGAALRGADTVLAVDGSLADEARQRARYPGGNIEILETRFSPDAWKPIGRKEKRVLTVANVPDRQRLHVKGIDTLNDAARRLPEVRFSVIGIHPDVIETVDWPPNVEVNGWLTRSDVLEMMRRSKVYCQPSRREGLSNALCEAMLCGCVPVATDVGGSRRAVGKTGFVVPPSDPDALARRIRIALDRSVAGRPSPRRQIMTMFPAGRRDARLRELISP